LRTGSANGLTASGKQVWYEGADGHLPSSTLEPGDAFETALASGDFNGDGFSDLAIGGPNRTMLGPDVDLFTEQPIQHLQAGSVVVMLQVADWQDPGYDRGGYHYHRDSDWHR
jgi:hypothetical protein